MSLRPNLREQRLKIENKTSAKLSLPPKLSLEESRSRRNHASISSVKNSQIPKLHVKLMSIANEDVVSSRRMLGGLRSTKTAKRINLSMISPTNAPPVSTRANPGDSFFFQRRRKSVRLPAAPEIVLENFKDMMNDFEQREIIEYKMVYFLGITSLKVIPDGELPNMGYDNDKGDYKIIVGDHLDYRYEVLSIIGKGSFGQVCKCLDHKTKEILAVKIIKNKRKFHKQGLIEVKLLKNMHDQDPDDVYHIVRIKAHFLFRNHLCIAFELLSLSLYDFLKQNNFKGLSLKLVAQFAIQMLIGLQFSKSLKIIHCDLKPENVLLKNMSKTGIKIIDFGSGCYDDERIYTYIQSRFYRAPEIMLGIPYSSAIDMWSFGCILVELYIGYPFFPGENEAEQFLRIVEVLGVPPESLLGKSTRKNVFFDSFGCLKIVPNSRGKIRYPGTRTFEDYIGKENPLFIEFLQDIIQWHPELRPSPSEALNHPWIASMIKKQPSSVKKRRVLKSLIDTSELSDM